MMTDEQQQRPDLLLDLSNRYEHSSEISSEVRLYWTLHTSINASASGGTIDLAVSYRLPRPRFYYEHYSYDDNDEDDSSMNMNGISTPADNDDDAYWLGFGVTPQGGMFGADMFLYLPPPPPPPPPDTRSISSNTTKAKPTAAEEKPGILIDAHGVSYSFPKVDLCGQDWLLLNFTSSMSSSSGGAANDVLVAVEVRRALQSHDVNEDLPFLNDDDSDSSIVAPTRVIAAWGRVEWDPGSREEANGRRHRRRRMAKNNASSSSADADADADADASNDNGVDLERLDLPSILVPHGPSGRVSGSVRFFGESSAVKGENASDGDSSAPTSSTMSEEELHYIDLVPSKAFDVPGEVTTYKNYCFTVKDYPELTDILAVHGQVHITGFRDIIGNDAGLVHHMDLHGTRNDILARDSRLCRTYLDLIHPWEAGSPTTFDLPSKAGIPLGGSGGYQAFRVEVHYHNPNRQSGLVDRSGVRVYYTVRKRPHVAGLMLLGDYEVKLRGTYTVGSVRKNSSEGVVGMRHSFYCPPSCFAEGLNSTTSSWGGVTVFREVLHMHQTGLRMTNIQLNGDGSPQRVSEANRFDFSQGAGYSTRANIPYRIEPNHSFITTCYFSERGTFWGSGSSEEMCQAFLWYYPKQEDLSLSCGYTDLSGRKRSGDDALDSLRPVGCEMSYDRSEVRVETDYDRIVIDEQCQAAIDSARPMDKYSVLDLNFRSWPSLVSLLRSWRKSSKSSGNIEVNSTLAPKNLDNGVKKRVDHCTLCWDGSRPTKPDAVIQGFSWTCNELDAALPILFTRPDLLFLSAKDIAQCQEYQKSFGEMCGCPALPNDGWKLGLFGNRKNSENSAVHALVAFSFLLVVVALVASIRKHH